MTLSKDVPAVGALLIAAQVLVTTAVRAAEIYTDDAPPPPKQQRMPHPRDGMIWAPGHWECQK